jgi:hypothetical protein
MILFLDDDASRTKAFKSRVPSALTAENAKDFIELLKKIEGDEPVQAFLDHDLGGEVYVDSSRENTGMEVVRWIVANNPKIMDIVVHSHNGPAAARMVVALCDAGYEARAIPFFSLIMSIGQSDF